MILQNGKRLDGCSDTVPVGTLQPFAGLTPPKGYLLCQGQLVSKITYSKLYEICGDMFGDGTETEFRLPDLRGKTIAGYDENDTAMNTIGKLLGQKTHTHTSAAHSHTVAGHTHTSAAHSHTSAAHSHSTGNHTLTANEVPSHSHSFTTAAAGNHTHRIYLNGDNSFPLYGHPGWNGEDVANAAKLNCGSGAFNGYHFRAGADATGGDGSHQHTGNVSWSGGGGAHSHGNTGSTTPGNTGSTTPGNTGSTSLTSDSTTPGATGSNSNYQPTITMNWIIKAVMLIPEYFIVENTLSSNSTENALSAAQGKALNDKFVDYATKAEMITYLPLKGGEITGSIKFPYGKYFSEDSYAIDLNNSDIINANSIYCADVANSYNEGIHFKRSNSNWDTISVYDGNFYLYTNSTADAAGTKNTILGTHNTKDYVVEYGTSGNWKYRKWNSGTAECWGSFVHSDSVTCSNPWGVVYETPHIGGAVSNYPISFVEVPHSSVDVQGTGSAYMSLERMGQTKSHIGSLYMTRPNTGTVYSAGFTITVHAIGRWK